MKRAVLVLCLLLPFSEPAFSESPDVTCCPTYYGYIGLFSNSEASNWCITGMGIFDWYLYALPVATEGMMCVELRTELSSSNIAVFNAYFGELILQPVLGGVPGDLAACFSYCQAGDWVRVFGATVSVMSTSTESIVIEPFTASPYPKFLDCSGVERETLVLTNLGINDSYCGIISVRESTWGAIKNMYE